MAKRKAVRGKRKTKPAGRPIEADSLRQDGYTLRVRMKKADAERYERQAGDEGLSAVVRRLLEEWANS